MYSNKFNIKPLLLVAITTCILSACLKPNTYPIEPVIEFKSFEFKGDSGVVKFSFTDGDGDIGLNDSDNESPFDTGSVYYNNIFIRYYEKVNGAWVQGTNPFGDPIEFKYRIQRITPTGNNKALKGEIIVNIVPIAYNPFSLNNDSIKYDIKLVDRAIHLSNIAETGEILR